MTKSKKAAELKKVAVRAGGKIKPSLAKAHEETSHNNAVLREVWGGKAPKTALAYEEDGGSIKRVGVPAGGYPPGVLKAMAAHTKLFGGKAPSIPGVTKPKAAAGRPRGRTTGADLSDKRIRLLAKANPFRDGSIKHSRFSKYVDGMTVAEYLAQVDFNPLKWDVAAGHIELY